MPVSSLFAGKHLWGFVGHRDYHMAGLDASLAFFLIEILIFILYDHPFGPIEAVWGKSI